MRGSAEGAPYVVWSSEQVLELLMRGGAVGAFLGAAITLARRPLTPARVTGVLSGLAAAAHTLAQFPLVQPALGLAWPAVWTFAVAGAGLLWAFATELFGDRPRLEPVRFAPTLLLLAIGLVAALIDGFGALWLLHNMIGGALMIHALFVIWTGWRNDLVESRRRIRGPVLAAAAVYAVVVTAVQTVEILWRPADALSPLAALTLFILGLTGIGAFLKADPDLFAAITPEAVAAGAEPLRALSPEDARLADKLDRLMREERAYRQEGLSVGGLALKLGVPEYRLRRLINRQLGHRNFSAFLNQWRLAEAREALADPSQRDVPVATIGLDAGFQSLGPFNRAFKSDTGLTPTEFRQRTLGAAAGEPGRLI